MLEALKARWREWTAPRFTGDWYFVHFVCGHRVPRGAKAKYSSQVPTRLPAEAMPGFSAVICFHKFGYQPQPVGSLTMVYGGREESRDLPEFPYFHVYLYPEDRGQLTLRELRFQADRQLPSLFARTLRVMLDGDESTYFAAPAAVGRLALLKEKEGREPDECALLEHLESARIFDDCQFPGDGPQMWNLSELREAGTLCLIDSSHGYKLCGRSRKPGLLFFEDSQEMAAVCRLYGLPRASDKQARDHLREALRKHITPAERKRAWEIGFGSARLVGRTVEVGLQVDGPAALSLDLDTRTLICRDARGSEVLMPLDSISRLDIEESSTRGDLKVHRYFHLAISDGPRTVLYYERYPEYYEGGEVQAELDREHEQSQSILHALAAAIDCPHARLERQDLIPKQTLVELLTPKP